MKARAPNSSGLASAAVNKDGSFPEIGLNPSTGLLKVLQRRLKTYISDALSLPDYAYGGSKKDRDNILNAAQHKGKNIARLIYKTVSLYICKDVCETLHKKWFHYQLLSNYYKTYNISRDICRKAPTSSIIQNSSFWL